jgi:hypothetical protein
MDKKTWILWFVLISSVAFYQSPSSDLSHAQTSDDKADITITESVIATNPERFGANVVPTIESDLNMWLEDAGMEGVIFRIKGKADGGGADFILHESDPQTDYWDTVYDG